MKTVRIALALSSVVAAAACSKSSDTAPPRSAQMEQASPESTPSEQATQSTPRANEPMTGSPQTVPPAQHPASGANDSLAPNSATTPTPPSVGGGPMNTSPDQDRMTPDKD